MSAVQSILWDLASSLNLCEFGCSLAQSNSAKVRLNSIFDTVTSAEVTPCGGEHWLSKYHSTLELKI